MGRRHDRIIRANRSRQRSGSYNSFLNGYYPNVSEAYDYSYEESPPKGRVVEMGAKAKPRQKNNKPPKDSAKAAVRKRDEQLRPKNAQHKRKAVKKQEIKKQPRPAGREELKQNARKLRLASIRESRKPSYEMVAESRTKLPVKSLGAIALFAVLSFLWLLSYGSVSVKTNEVSKLQTALSEARDNTEAQAYKLEQSIDWQEIENIARNQLGMKTPEQYQMVYVEVPQEDYVISYDVETKTEGQSFSIINTLFR